jgi:hypothetical protein
MSAPLGGGARRELSIDERDPDRELRLRAVDARRIDRDPLPERDARSVVRRRVPDARQVEPASSSQHHEEDDADAAHAGESPIAAGAQKYILQLLQ